ncbi:transglycosylase SLT domain-containing protein [Pseudorhodobacter sp. W20_MBD10_FR17]|uniref:transglycosylase SLT domain-containing protein n=1 Tax=Pseudorhodobacter sp. W20_MBD10_FR17 TaxID=3240266 RepID=UPI003F9E33A9
MHKWRLYCAMVPALYLGLFSALAQASICEDAARHASESTGVPLSVLRAVALAETGQTKFTKNEYAAWPWTVQSGQKGHWFSDKAAAMQFVQTLMATQTTNIDIGCFQINMRWHGQAFQSLDDMFSPRSNALYAAQFLQKLYSQTGEWRAAVGRYHSNNDARAEAYVQRLERLFETHLAGGGIRDPSVTVKERKPTPKQAQQQFSLSGARGPILLISSAAQPLISAPHPVIGGRP